MDAKQTSDPNVLLLQLSMSEAHDIGQLIDHFRRWELIASASDKEPMLFMLRFGTDCRFAANGEGALHYPIESGEVPLSLTDLGYVARFLKACVEADGRQMPWTVRNYLTLAWKTLDNRLMMSGAATINVRQGFFRKLFGG